MDGEARESRSNRRVIEMSPAGENPQSNGDDCLGASSSIANCIETGGQKMRGQSSLVGERLNTCSGDGTEEVGESLPPNQLLYHQPAANNSSISSANPKSKLSRSTATSSSPEKGESRISSKQSLKRSSDSDNIVTTSMTRNSSSSSDWQDGNHATTSSGSGGDDYDRGSFMKVENAIEASMRISGEAIPNKETKEHTNGKTVSAEGDVYPPRKKARHHPSPQDPHPPTSWTHEAGIKSPSPKDDGSSLQVPGDDGSDRIVAGDVAGGVPIKPATVVASRLFSPTTASTGTDHSISSSEPLGSKQNSSSKTSDLLPPDREPRYHTIRDTLYRFNGNERTEKSKKHSHRRRGMEKKSSERNDKTDPSSTEEVVNDTITTNTSVPKHHHHRHRGSRSSGSNSSASSQKQRVKRAEKKSRSIGSLDVTSNANAESVKSKNSNLTSPVSSLQQEANTGGSSSGSGTEGTEDGYAGSISSNENGSGNQQLGSSSPCPSETSSEEYEQQEGRRKVRLNRRSNNSKQKSSGEDQESSEIADFGSSGCSETMDEEDEGNRRRQDNSKAYGRSTSYSSSSSSPSFSSSIFSESDRLELAFLSAKRDADAEHERKLKLITRKKKSKQTALNGSMTKSLSSSSKPSKRMASKRFKDGRPPILAMGCDVMAHILTFLQPPDILNVLTMPLSKGWRRNFTSQPELWRVLCLVEPFKATVDDDSISPSRDSDEEAASSSDDSYCRLKEDKSLDKYRLLYTSFVRCMKYVAQIREDAINGRPPAYIDYGISGAFSNDPGIQYIANTIKGNNDRSSSPPPPTELGSNRNLQLFLAQANEVMNSSNNNDGNNSGGETKTDDTLTGMTIFPTLSTAARVGTGHNKVRKKFEIVLSLFV